VFWGIKRPAKSSVQAFWDKNPVRTFCPEMVCRHVGTPRHIMLGQKGLSTAKRGLLAVAFRTEGKRKKPMKRLYKLKKNTNSISSVPSFSGGVPPWSFLLVFRSLSLWVGTEGQKVRRLLYKPRSAPAPFRQDHHRARLRPDTAETTLSPARPSKAVLLGSCAS
jgi:hypothetical protein